MSTINANGNVDAYFNETVNNVSSQHPVNPSAPGGEGGGRHIGQKVLYDHCPPKFDMKGQQEGYGHGVYIDSSNSKATEIPKAWGVQDSEFKTVKVRSMCN
jgi:hypothetical protein